MKTLFSVLILSMSLSTFAQKSTDSAWSTVHKKQDTVVKHKDTLDTLYFRIRTSSNITYVPSTAKTGLTLTTSSFRRSSLPRRKL